MKTTIKPKRSFTSSRAIVVTRRQDYENVQTRQGYFFEVVVGAVTNRVVLLIENINDNLHVMSPIDSCVVDVCEQNG